MPSTEAALETTRKAIPLPVATSMEARAARFLSREIEAGRLSAVVEPETILRVARMLVTGTAARPRRLAESA